MSSPSTPSTPSAGRRTVVVGAGLFGLATALHLARAGRDVTIVESDTVASGTTKAGAGFVGLWAAGYAWYWNTSERDLEQYGIDFYRDLAATAPATGHDISLRETGNVWLAVTDQGVTDHLDAFATHPLRPAGARRLTPAEAAELVPGLDAGAVSGGFLHPGGIQISAPDAGLALGAAVRAAGVRVIEHAAVTDVVVGSDTDADDDRRVGGVRLADGSVIDADEVVLAAGSWTNDLLRPLGRVLPLARVVASRVTTPAFGLPSIPTLMIPELDGLWVRENHGGLTYGNGVGYETLAARGTPADRRPSRVDLIEAMNDHLAPVVAGLFPASSDAVERTEWTQGVVSYTADRRFIAGAVPELAGLFVLAGDNESGVTHGPGLGRLLAEVVTTGDSTIGDPTLYDPARFAADAFADETAVALAMPPRRETGDRAEFAVTSADLAATSTGDDDGIGDDVIDVDVLVIGAGVVGAAAAYAVSRRGASVLVVEQFERAHHRGSSHGATRIFRQGYVDDDYVSMTSRALAAWRELEQESGRRILELTGAVDHGDPTALAAIAAAFDRFDISYERLTPDAASARWPGLRFDREVVFHPTGGRIHSAVAIDALLDRAVAAGAELLFDTGVTALSDDGDGVTATLRSSDGGSRTVRAGRVVVAAGSWVPALVEPILAAAGLALPPVVVTQEQPAHFATTVPDELWPSFVHYPSDGPGIYGLLIPGEGVKVGEHGTGPVVDPDERDFEPEPERLARLVEYVTTWVPGVVADAPAPISCVYDTTPTEDFVLDRVGRVAVATGFAGHGFKFGPVLGEILADLIDGHDAPARFRLGRS